MHTHVLVKLVDVTGRVLLSPTQVPLDITSENILSLVSVDGPAVLHLYGRPFSGELGKAIRSHGSINIEEVLIIRVVYYTDMVRPGRYCSSSVEGHAGPVLCMLCTGKTLVTGGGDGFVKFWCSTTRTVKKSYNLHNHWVMALCIVNGTVLSGGMDGVVFSYTDDGGFLRKVGVHQKGVTRMAALDDMVVCGSMDGAVKVWKLSGEYAFGYRHAGSVTSIFTEGEKIISGSDDGKIILSEGADRRKELLTNSRVNCIASHDEYVISGGDDGYIHIWKNGSVVNTTFHKREVIDLAISPCKTFFVSSSFDRVVAAWEFPSGRKVFEYKHHRSVYGVKIIGEMIISFSADHTVKMASYERREVVSTLKCSDEVYCVCAMNGDIIAGCKNKVVNFFR